MSFNQNSFSMPHLSLLKSLPYSSPAPPPSSSPLPSSLQKPAINSPLIAVKSNHIFYSPWTSPFSGYLLIAGERVEGLTEEKPVGYNIVDRTDDFIIPGLIDLHVHLNATTEWEEIENVTKMAVKGGVTTIVDHPISNDYEQNDDEVSMIKERISKISKLSYVDFGLLAYLGPHNLENLTELWEKENILGFNIFLSPCIQSYLPHFDPTHLKNLQKILNKMGKKVIPHSSIKLTTKNNDKQNQGIESSDIILNTEQKEQSDSIQKLTNIPDNENERPTQETSTTAIIEEELEKSKRPNFAVSSKMNSYNDAQEEINKGNPISNRRMLISIHPEYATARDLFMSSPLRTKNNNDRLDLEVEILDEGKFGGGIAGEMEPGYSGGDAEDEEVDEYNDEMFNKTPLGSSHLRSRILRRMSLRNAKKQEEQGISRLEMIGYSLNEEEVETIRKEEAEELERKVVEEKKPEEDEHGGDWEDIILSSSSDDDETKKYSENKRPAPIEVSKMKLNWGKEENHHIDTKKNFKTNILISEIRGILNVIKPESPKFRSHTTIIPIPASSSPIPNSPLVSQTIPPFCSRDLADYSAPPPSDATSPATTVNSSPLSLLQRRQKLSRSLGPLDKGFLHDFHIDIKEVKKKETEIISKNNDKTNRDYNFFLYNHSLSWETNGVKMCLRHLKKTHKANLLFGPLSSASSAFEIQEKRKNSQHFAFYTELATPYLCFHKNLIKPGKTKFKNSPPIRDKETRDLMIEGLLVEDLIHVVSSGHNSQDIKLKKVGHSNFRRAINGISCIGCNLNVVWSILYSKWRDKLTLEELIMRTIALTSYYPAILGSLIHSKGSLEPGKHADFVIWRPFKVVTINDDDIILKNKRQYVFRKRKFYGEIVETYLRGERVYGKGGDFFKKGEIIGNREKREN